VGQLLEPEENQPHFSMWQKIRLVAGGVCVGLATLVPALVEVEIEFTEKTDWEICVGWV